MSDPLRSLLAILVVLSAVAAPVPAAAQGRRSRPAKDAPPPFDPHLGKRLNKAIEELEKGASAQARATLEGIDLERASPYEVSRIEQLFAAIDQTEEKYDSARVHLEKALASGGLNDKEMSSTRFQIAKLYLAQAKWAEGVKELETWFAAEPAPNAAAYYALAAAHYQAGNFAAAATPAQKAVDMAGDKAQESWLQLLLAVRAQQKEYDLAFPTLMRLIERLPNNKLYWMQGASVALSMEKYDTATALLQLAHTAGFLAGGDEIQRLVELLLHDGIPYRAARLLAAAIDRKQMPETPDTYEFLGNCWIAAREFDKAIEPLGRAGELADGGEPYVRLAEVHVQREEWSKASAALERALSKGKLKRPGDAQLLLGLALYNQKRVQDARAWFERARAHSESRAQAEGWLRQTDPDQAH